MSTLGWSKNRKAICHLGRKHKARNLCGSCYVLWLTGNYRDEKAITYRQMKLLTGRISQLAKKTGRPYKDIKLEADELLDRHKVCEICSDFENLCLDHDYRTGKMRGILCRKCNSSIAFLKEDQDNFRNAIRYLMKSERLARCA